ncbi:unnamed protein product [Schistocephalus solidus]|uniref:Uncharacterized protein n=1 Tax=Schistocephalus solidus TaxID=70667 RepID=A0A183TSV9_SCHSO|nr:unnamed protein product [Schistocephalus solidus]
MLKGTLKPDEGLHIRNFRGIFAIGGSCNAHRQRGATVSHRVSPPPSSALEFPLSLSLSGPAPLCHLPLAHVCVSEVFSIHHPGLTTSLPLSPPPLLLISSFPRVSLRLPSAGVCESETGATRPSVMHGKQRCYRRLGNAYPSAPIPLCVELRFLLGEPVLGDIGY